MLWCATLNVNVDGWRCDEDEMDVRRCSRCCTLYVVCCMLYVCVYLGTCEMGHSNLNTRHISSTTWIGFNVRGIAVLPFSITDRACPGTLNSYLLLPPHPAESILLPLHSVTRRVVEIRCRCRQSSGGTTSNFKLDQRPTSVCSVYSSHLIHPPVYFTCIDCCSKDSLQYL